MSRMLNIIPEGDEKSLFVYRHYGYYDLYTQMKISDAVIAPFQFYFERACRNF